jgi:5-hydroxyisourate hydrolase-like protein (transthyretin family)
MLTAALRYAGRQAWDYMLRAIRRVYVNSNSRVPIKLLKTKNYKTSRYGIRSTLGSYYTEIYT